MQHEHHHRQQILTGVGLAVLATIIWSGNFIIARGVIKDIPPVTLAFYRWFTATIIIAPFAWKYFFTELKIIKERFWFFFLAAVTGVSMFNTFVYIAGHYSSAINMAIIGTCSSPIMSVILARIFLKEKISTLRIVGMTVCVLGVLLLLSKGDIHNLISFRFTKGDWWILAAALSFAIYNTMVKKKPKEIHPVNFLFTVFLLGTIILLPFYFSELNNKGGIAVNTSNILTIIYLGLGTSVICFYIWNKAIAVLGTGRTALFGNLIPVFSSIEAVIILHEQFSWIHIVSMILVFAGIIITNLRSA
jgi:drug/metabolite transporter (DMT)-like permease